MTLLAISKIVANVPVMELRRATDLVLTAQRTNKTLFFIGNGGSAAIASHMAADFLKNGGMRAQCFNEGALLTCLANDLGYDQVFSKPLGIYINAGDVLFAISSSGQSASILNAVKECGTKVITLSGFRPDNPLRKLGNVNFYVESDQYGVVEVAHHAICHAVLDRVMSDAA